MTKEETNILANRIASNATMKMFEGDVWHLRRMLKSRVADILTRKEVFDLIYAEVLAAITVDDNANCPHLRQSEEGTAHCALAEAEGRVISAAQDVMLNAEYVDESDLCPSHVPIYAVKAEAFRRLRDALQEAGTETFQEKQLDEFKKGE